VAGCHRAPGGLHAPTDEIPAWAAIAGASYEFGFVTGRLRVPVTVDAFSISVTPITVGQYKECIAAGACTAPLLTVPSAPSCRTRTLVIEGSTFDESKAADALPVTCVTPRQAVAYCAWIGGKLPTMEEWVYAARGSTVQQFAWGNDLPDCTKHPRAIPIRPPATGCCNRCDPSTFFATGQHPAAQSVQGMVDVLLTPAELLRGHKGAPVPACSGEGGACAVYGRIAGSIENVVGVADDVTQDAYADPGAAAGFRCVVEVKP
jgi:hypothetical protein